MSVKAEHFEVPREVNTSALVTMRVEIVDGLKTVAGPTIFKKQRESSLKRGGSSYLTLREE
jgi:hypothetical protein